MAAALLVGACGGGSSASPQAPASPAPGGSPRAGLDDRTFLSTAIEGRALVAGSRVRLSFQGDRLGASAGCNSMSGSYAIDGGRLVARQLATTEMGCEAPLMEQDQWLGSLLDGATITLDGDTLSLAKDGVRLTLLDREVADPDRPLIGTRWILDGLISGGSVSSVAAGVTAVLTFSNGRVDVEAGCNTGGGTVEIADGLITFGPIALTKMACVAEMMAVERAVTGALSGQVRYTIQAGALTLDAGGKGLTLRAAP